MHVLCAETSPLYCEIVEIIVQSTDSNCTFKLRKLKLLGYCVIYIVLNVLMVSKEQECSHQKEYK